jgi:hypothetical protein
MVRSSYHADMQANALTSIEAERDAAGRVQDILRGESSGT